MENQKPHNIEEQIRLLRDKGMNFSDDEEREAKECFSAQSESPVHLLNYQVSIVKVKRIVWQSER